MKYSQKNFACGSKLTSEFWWIAQLFLNGLKGPGASCCLSGWYYYHLHPVLLRSLFLLQKVWYIFNTTKRLLGCILLRRLWYESQTKFVIFKKCKTNKIVQNQTHILTPTIKYVWRRARVWKWQILLKMTKFTKH